MTHLPAEYVGATYTVVDASSFPRTCPGPGACIDLLTAPQDFVQAPSDARQNVSPTLLTLKTGDKLITPDDEDKTTMRGAQSSTTVSYKVCADETGKIDTITLLQPSALPNYDKKVERTIRKEWSYEPYVFGSQPIAFCTAVTFIYSQK